MLTPRRQPRAGLALTALCLALVTACGSESEGTEAGESTGGGSGTRTFAADNGEVEIPEEPQRVVATGYAVPTLIEGDAALVGISTWKRGLPLMSEEDRATYDELPKVAGEMAAETNYEAIAEAKPDLIVIGVPAPALGDLDMERLESIAPVAVVGPTLPDAWKELNERQLDAAGRLAELEAGKEAYDAKAAELEEKYADVLADLDFGHVGAYGDVAQGTFHREFAGSWGTNIAEDIGVRYTGEVEEKGGGAADVSEYPSIEELPESLGDVDAITYTLSADGSGDGAVSPEVQYVLDSALWKKLPAVKEGNVFGIQYTEAATYPSALRTLEGLDAALEPLLS